MQLAKDGTIILDLEETLDANHTSILCEHHVLCTNRGQSVWLP